MSASELLRQFMQNLRAQPEVKSSLPPLVPLKRPSRPHPSQFSYPPRHRHTQFYGFWIDEQWLIELGKNIQDPEDRVRPPKERDLWFRGFSHICWAVRIDPLTVELCFQPSQDGAPPEYVDAEGEVFVLSVCSDNEEDELVIPFQEQVDYLATILGREPRWWVSVWPEC
ncbi:uncharacterized protein EDB91DRAFT_1348299 [Suillus paluster]|uniref:uncharacterized protein n=1 Tax=Suillus paluster TaxID=48578 RepID=UPI001B868685|nr:uncharacterized protein EDB91DRAFT_1348299 [Suillus paluster]KAG1735264.1 hypothetical protein EDB91DRAFT_1348299 [Suillus paluster]